MFLNINQLGAFCNAPEFTNINFSDQRLMDALEYSVASAKGALQIHGLEVSDKRLPNWEAFVTERRVKPGDRFQPIH
jgi:hypothetical protein